MPVDYDVIVVGAGPGGTCCAALLAKKGLKVLLLDKNAKVGGKTMDLNAKGVHGERWITAGFITTGPFARAYKMLGIESKLNVSVKPIVSIYRHHGMKWSRKRPAQIVVDMEMFSAGMDPNQLFDQWGLKDKKKRDAALQALAEIYAGVQDPATVDKWDDISIRDWFAQRPEIPREVYQYLAYIAQVTQEGVPELLPMACFRTQFSEVQSPMGYPRGGYGRLSEDMAEVFKQFGGEIVLRNRVERILVEKGCASGVLTKKGLFRAPIVVSDAGIQPTVIKLVGEEYFDKSYVSYVKELLPSLGFNGVRYVLREPILEHALYQISSDVSWLDLGEYLRLKAGGAPRDVTISLVVTTNYDPDMGPLGKQVLLFGTNCSPDTRDNTMLKAVNKRMEEQLLEIFPEIGPAIESKGYAGPREVAALSRDETRPGTGGEFALAMCIGQTGKYKPKAQSPIPGLFYVGFDAGHNRHLMGSQGACDSGINAAEMVYRYYQGQKYAGW
jgi:phytoene dehydrogenase-like protein